VLVKLLSQVSFYIPELICIFLMCALLFIESAYKKEEKDRTMIYIVSLIGLVAALGSLISNLSLPAVTIFENAVVIDKFSTLIKIIMVLGTLGVIYIGKVSNDIYSELKSEFIIMTLGVLVGGMLLASANNMLTLYLGIETLSILSYVLSSFKKRESESTEAGLKYALYGGLTAGIMLFGMSHIYGQLGTIQFVEIVAKIQNIQGADAWLLMASFFMFFAGIGYKVSAFPFHMWSPDVYQGSPIPVTSFFSIVPKIAGMAVLLRVTLLFFNADNEISKVWIGLLHVIAALTMTVGNVSAIGQDSVKRMLAFSSIGHVGMMILGVVVVNEVGTSAIVFYGITYLFMTLVAFLITSFVADDAGSDSQMSFKGLIYRHPIVGIAMVIVLFSLAGLPPMSGFIAKFNILNVIIEKKYYGLAFIAALNSVVALYFYMKLVRVIVLGKMENFSQIPNLGFINQLVIIILVVPVLVLGISWEGILNLSEGAKLFTFK
jgi:NADH-quinone oxidoreductase subunit N